jgi:hypothetical protein
VDGWQSASTRETRLGLKGCDMTTSDAAFEARAAIRRATWTMRVYSDLDQMKAAEYAYWQGQPAHVRLAAAAELTAEAYAMKGVHVSRLQRSLVRTQRT